MSPHRQKLTILRKGWGDGSLNPSPQLKPHRFSYLPPITHSHPLPLMSPAEVCVDFVSVADNSQHHYLVPWLSTLSARTCWDLETKTFPCNHDALTKKDRKRLLSTAPLVSALWIASSCNITEAQNESSFLSNSRNGFNFPNYASTFGGNLSLEDFLSADFCFHFWMCFNR